MYHLIIIIIIIYISYIISLPSDLTFLGTSNYINKTLYLTQSVANENTQIWINKPFNISSILNITFVFQIKNSSNTCVLDPQESQFCDGKGSNGFALVFHNDPRLNLTTGQGERGIGYAGINNSIAIEFDTWWDEYLNEPYNDHISVQTNGTLGPLSADLTQSLSISSDFTPFSNYYHHVKILYYPDAVTNSSIFDPKFCHPFCNKVQVTPQLGYLGENGLITKPGQLYFYLDDILLFITAINLNDLINNPTAMIGFTSSTGSDAWQSHQVSNFRICSSDEADCRDIL